MKKLKNSRVAVFGVGGVGGYAAEALARSGVGAIDLIDADDIAESNLNRQIVALTSTLGKGKAETAAQRIADIDPSIVVTVHRHFYLPDDRGDVDLAAFDYIIDAIDTVSAKLDIIENASKLGIPVISAMGCGNRLDPSRLRICDIGKTFNDPLSKVIRRKLKNCGISKLDVVFSDELPRKLGDLTATDGRLPASMVFVPACAGLMMAGYVCRKLAGME